MSRVRPHSLVRQPKQFTETKTIEPACKCSNDRDTSQQQYSRRKWGEEKRLSKIEITEAGRTQRLGALRMSRAQILYSDSLNGPLSSQPIEKSRSNRPYHCSHAPQFLIDSLLQQALIWVLQELRKDIVVQERKQDETPMMAAWKAWENYRSRLASDTVEDRKTVAVERGMAETAGREWLVPVFAKAECLSDLDEKGVASERPDWNHVPMSARSKPRAPAGGRAAAAAVVAVGNLGRRVTRFLQQILASADVAGASVEWIANPASLASVGSGTPGLEMD